MKPLITIDGHGLWFDADADAQGSPGYYWMNQAGEISVSRYHNEDDATSAMKNGEVVFTIATSSDEETMFNMEEEKTLCPICKTEILDDDIESYSGSSPSGADQEATIYTCHCCFYVWSD